MTKLKVGCNVESLISIGTGTLAAMTDYDHVYLNAKQTWTEISDGKSPVMVINNDSATAIDVFIYAKGGANFGIVDNNIAGGGTKFLAVIGGFEI